ncbi:GntR family transcriptional regulator [uncultured Roseobacter sp.]|uniref:GntR family transcriptional regulator n=1 Tax=uncultured Roseobacter sp. TaxID=114847 RepID=UPI00261FCFE7|nr:GntR family transcriptional regulator [uncultured Roseobacter sp.]
MRRVLHAVSQHENLDTSQHNFGRFLRRRSKYRFKSTVEPDLVSKFLLFFVVEFCQTVRKSDLEAENMAVQGTLERTTSSDVVFDELFGRITRLELLPGTKISETDVAKSFGYSRQPVREAFTRLANLNLLLVRPQRATVVRPFSRRLIANARFVRAAIELEVVRLAASDRDRSVDAALKSNLREQGGAVADGDVSRFHDLDYQFHRLLCASARQAFAFDIIAENKAQVDRLCMLALTSKEAMDVLYEDHTKLLKALFGGDAQAADDVLRVHLDRLTPTIDAIYTTHNAYFDE